MRIGYVVKQYPRYSETFIVNEILAHEQAGHFVEIFSLRPASDGHFQDLLWRVRGHVQYVPEAYKSSEFWAGLAAAGKAVPEMWDVLSTAVEDEGREVFQAAWLARQARVLGLEHFHAHFASVASNVARLAARMSGLTYSFTAHAKDIYHESVASDQLATKLREAVAVVTVSDYNLAHLRETFGAAAAHVTRIYNGLDLERFPFDDRPRTAPVIVSVGRLVEKKGFDVLIEACAILARTARPFTCEIIGAGEQELALREQVQRLGVEPWVRLSGPRPQFDVIDAVRSAAVLAAPCVVGGDGNRDGLPTVLLEAMALGTPCVSTDVTGIPEIIDDGRTGLLVAQRDPEALAAAIERLLADADLRRQVALAARAQIERDFDVCRNAADLRDVFAQSISSREPILQEVC